MTDIEIDRALALAIGHEAACVNVFGEDTPQVWVQVNPRYEWTIRVFSHKDWNVIGPIAERYNMFPYRAGGWWNVAGYGQPSSQTPQKAIALSVIGAKK